MNLLGNPRLSFVPSLRDSEIFFMPTQGFRPGLIYFGPTGLAEC